MTKLKSARLLAAEMLQSEIPVFEFIQAIQQNAIEAALEVAAKNAKLETEYKGGKLCPDFYVDRQSITSLINHKDLKV